MKISTMSWNLDNEIYYSKKKIVFMLTALWLRKVLRNGRKESLEGSKVVSVISSRNQLSSRKKDFILLSTVWITIISCFRIDEFCHRSIQSRLVEQILCIFRSENGVSDSVRLKTSLWNIPKIFIYYSCGMLTRWRYLRYHIFLSRSLTTN
jgi:hypothetical protein